MTLISVAISTRVRMQNYVHNIIIMFIVHDNTFKKIILPTSSTREHVKIEYFLISNIVPEQRCRNRRRRITGRIRVKPSIGVAQYFSRCES